jgi:hypothetical protein
MMPCHKLLVKKKEFIGYILLKHFTIGQRVLVKNSGENHHPMVGKKTTLVILNLLKLTCLRTLEGFIYACHFGVSFDRKT